MGGIGKTARRIGRNVTKIVHPVGHKILRKSGIEKGVTDVVDKYVYGVEDPIPLEEPKIMPDEDDLQLKKAKRRSTARQRRRSGRASTVLSQDGLGG